MDFNNIANGLSNEQEQEQPQASVNVTLITLGGADTLQITPYTTVRQFKEQQGLSGVKMVDETGRTVSDSEYLADGIQLFVSTPKKNG